MINGNVGVKYISPKQLAGMLDTVDLSAWEQTFVRSVAKQAKETTQVLTMRQVEVIEEIWRRHFA